MINNKIIILIAALIFVSGCSHGVSITRCDWQPPENIGTDCRISYSGFYYDNDQGDCDFISGCMEDIPFRFNETYLGEVMDECVDSGESIFTCIKQVEEIKKSDLIFSECRSVCLE